MDKGKVKVLYIAGNGRSGSTILDVILGQPKGFFPVGELRRIWDRGLIENRPCGCSVPFRECPTWTEIFQEAYGGMDAIDAKALVKYRERMTQTKHLPSMLIRNKRTRNTGSELKEYLGKLDKLYSSIHRVTDCNVIVDSSKWPMYAYMLDLLPSIELYILHLIRDPRAVAFSWKRRKQYEENKLLPRQSTLKSTFYWLAWNPAITYLWNHPSANYMFLPYENFVLNPQEVVAKILSFIQEEKQALPFINKRTIEITRGHAVAGNIARLTDGPVTLKIDDEWKTNLAWTSKFLVSALAWPFLYKYGYRFSIRN